MPLSFFSPHPCAVMTATPFDQLSSPADPTDGNEGLARLLEGLGFRLRWACEGLSEADCAAEPVDGAWSIGEQLAHLTALVRWGRRALEDGSAGWSGNVEDNRHPLAYVEILEDLSATIELLRSTPKALSAAELTAGSPDHVFSAGYLVNGPWADALHHVGQITLLRKILGRPAPAAQPFLGQPPSAS